MYSFPPSKFWTFDCSLMVVARTVNPICLHLVCMLHLHAANLFMYFIFVALDECALVNLPGDRSGREVGRPEF